MNLVTLVSGKPLAVGSFDYRNGTACLVLFSTVDGSVHDHRCFDMFYIYSLHYHPPSASVLFFSSSPLQGRGSYGVYGLPVASFNSAQISKLYSWDPTTFVSSVLSLKQVLSICTEREMGLSSNLATTECPVHFNCYQRTNPNIDSAEFDLLQGDLHHSDGRICLFSCRG